MFKLFKRSEKYRGETFRYNDNITITSFGAVTLPWAEFVPASFRIEIDGIVIYVDPFLIEKEEEADLILITHEHMDHCSPKDIRKLLGDNTRILAPHGAVRKLRKFPNVTEVAPREVHELLKLSVETVPSYNFRKTFLTPHPKKEGNVGYVLKNHGVKILHPGDSDAVPELQVLKGITIAMLPVGGDGLTMDCAQAIGLTESLKPEVVIPMHYEIGREKELLNILPESITVKRMLSEE